jgi:hypothetical protein
MNVSKKKFNKCFTVHNDYDYHIVNENARKTLCNLFDALGNISSYNDYNSFVEKYNGFSKFNKCTISRNLKTPIELSQGILVVVDSKTGELSLPSTKQLDWFLDKYQYSTSVIIPEESEITEEPKLVQEPKPVQEPKREVIILDEEITVEVKKGEAPKSSGGFWSYFGWN